MSHHATIHGRKRNVRFSSIFVNMQRGVAQAWRKQRASKKTRGTSAR
jgi:hypothetical protein